jgi:uncharacterized protein (TIGR03435 family)
MMRRPLVNFSFRKKLPGVIGIAVVVAALIFGAVSTPRLHAQSPTADWEKSAGGKMSFDVTSVKENTADKFSPPNVPLDISDSYPPNGGLFSATDVPLSVYIEFAYKLMLTPGQTEALLSGLPKWANDRFDIQARAAGNPTKNQMRLMMQSLLADRFKLAVHFEARQLPVFALVLDKPGKMGPHLRPHTEGIGGPACDAAAVAPGNNTDSDDSEWAPPACDGLKILASHGHLDLQARNVALEWFADALPTVGNLDRPVSDQTGLKGRFDFRMKFNGKIGAGPGIQPDESGPSFLEALHDQLGLKLESTIGPVQTLIIDHIEEPSPN